MNRIYKVIYSKAHQCYIVVSELAKRNHKSSQPSIDHSTTAPQPWPASSPWPSPPVP